MIDEPACAEPGVAASAAADPAQYRVPETLCGGAVDIINLKAAFLDRCRKTCRLSFGIPGS
jgi:hypothetical protein